LSRADLSDSDSFLENEMESEHERLDAAALKRMVGGYGFEPQTLSV